MGLTVHIDGGARGNPGPAGAGVVITDDDGKPVHEGAYFLGRQTNNAAEYLALIHALERVVAIGEQTVTVYSDSQLMVRQITGEYRVKSGSLAELFQQAQRLLLRIACWNVKHVGREENQRADQLANLAMDRGCDVIVFDREGAKPRTSDAGSARETAAEGNAAPIARAETPRAVCVVIAKKPNQNACPSGSPCEGMIEIGASLPRGLCVFAAHALLPTILGVQNTAAAELAGLPTLTVRCSRDGCGAEFHVTARKPTNGNGPK